MCHTVHSLHMNTDYFFPNCAIKFFCRHARSSRNQQGFQIPLGIWGDPRHKGRLWVLRLDKQWHNLTLNNQNNCWVHGAALGSALA